MRPTSKSQVNRAGERFSKYLEQAEDREVLLEYRRLRCAVIPYFSELLVELAQWQTLRVSFRLKRSDTVIRKLRRMGTTNLTQLDDLLAYRVIASSPTQQLAAQTWLQGHLQVAKVRDYINTPPASCYRALHMIASTPEREDTFGSFRVEIQVRTVLQHLWGTLSEGFGEAVKDGQGPAEVRTWLCQVSAEIRRYETDNLEANQSEFEVLEDAQPKVRLIVFDKITGVPVETLDYEDVYEGLSDLESFEDRQSDRSKEIVLLGSFGNPAIVFRQTHSRYHVFRGIPAIPEYLNVHVPAEVSAHLESQSY